MDDGEFNLIGIFVVMKGDWAFDYLRMKKGFSSIPNDSTLQDEDAYTEWTGTNLSLDILNILPNLYP